MQPSFDLLIRCGQLVTCRSGGRPRAGSDASDVGAIPNGALAIRDGRVAWCGPAAEAAELSAARVADWSDACVVPGLVDAHTHPIWAGSRVDEFQMRARGATYLEIHAAGGGILSTVRATRAASRADLVARTRHVFERMLAHGTTTVEAKSGYGLDEAEEIRGLEVIAEAAAALPLRVVRTFLGAHSVPPTHADGREQYVAAVAGPMLERVAAEGLARFCDVFCDEGAFTLDESRRILEAARARGLGLKIHAEEFAYLGGARMAAALGATSADHLLSLPPDDFAALRDAGTVAVLLPGTTLFLGKERYAPARGLIDAGVPVAVATDFNAGSCMTESLPAAMALAVLKMGMAPEEAILGGTVNGAHAAGCGDRAGSLEPGRDADFLVLDVADYREWLYHFGVNLVREVWVGGARWR